MNVSATETASGPRSQASGRKNAIRLVMLASAANLARDKHTLPRGLDAYDRGSDRHIWLPQYLPAGQQARTRVG